MMIDSDEDRPAPTTRRSSRGTGSQPRHPFTVDDNHDVDMDERSNSPNALRQQKLDRQRQLEDQRRKQRQSAAGMVFNTEGDGRRPSSAARRQPSAKSRRDDRDRDRDEAPQPRFSSGGSSRDYERDRERDRDRESRVDREERESRARDSRDSRDRESRDSRPSRTRGAPETTVVRSYDSDDEQPARDIQRELQSRGISTTYDPRDEADADEAPIQPQPSEGNARQRATSMSIDINDENLLDFVTQPGPQGHKILCRITRDKKGLEKGMYPTYYLHMEREGGKKVFLLAARKRKKSTSSNYLLSIDPTNMARDGETFVGKLRSNFLGTNFIVYSNGCNPRSKKAMNGNIREELAAITYGTNVMGLKGPRKMTVIIPGMKSDGRRVSIRPTSESEGMLEKAKRHQLKDILILHNKSPVWNDETQSYVLNFHGRVTVASVKNFQVVHDDDPDYIIMQFGRISDEVFTCDFQYPMSAIQAFSIALSSFDGKLACE